MTEKQDQLVSFPIRVSSAGRTFIRRDGSSLTSSSLTPGRSASSRSNRCFRGDLWKGSSPESHGRIPKGAAGAVLLRQCARSWSSSLGRNNLLRYSFANHRIIYALKDFGEPISRSSAAHEQHEARQSKHQQTRRRSNIEQT